MQSAFFFLFSAGSFFHFHSISLCFPSVHLALLFCSLTLPSFSFSLIFQNLPAPFLSCLFLPTLVFSSLRPLSLSLFPLGSVPAPLPWHWANSSPPLRLLPFLYTPCLWLMAPLFWKERKGNRERGRARGKGSSKAHMNIKTAHTEARKAHTRTHIPTEL